MAFRQDLGQSTDRKLDVMIDQLLPPNFNLRIWQLISSKRPQEFINSQRDILNILLSDSKLFQSFFLKFYTNHQHLNNWYMLANSNQIDIKKYVFSQLLVKKFKQYRQIIKNQEIQTRYCRTNQVFREKQELRKESKKQSFHKMYLSNAKKNIILNPPSKQKQPTLQSDQKCQYLQKEVEKQDYHQLFQKTFNACDGSKYIYYDFNKHMRGISGKKRYNEFIRVKKHRKNQSNFIEFNLATQIQKESIRKREQGAKNTHSSVYNKSFIDYLHQRQEKLSQVNYCSIQMDAIGQIKKKNYTREFILLKKTTGGLKKVKSNVDMNKFQLRKIKVL